MDDATVPGLPRPPAGQPRPLTDFLGAAMEPRRAAALARQMAQALATAHAQGQAHGDLRPSNVFIEEDGGPRLAHFQPQASGRDAAQDQFMLGALLYQMITGRRPFEGKAVPDAPSVVLASLPRDLDAICLRALEEDHARRYASIAEMAADLGRFLAGDPVHARPPAARGGSLGVTAGVAACVLLAGGATWWAATRDVSPPPAPPPPVETVLPPPAPAPAPAPKPEPPPPPDPSVLALRRGQALFAKGDAKGAIAEYDRAIAANPSNVEAIVSRAVAYHASGDVDRAITECDRALSVDLTYAPAWMARGFAKRQKKDLDGAIEDFDAAIKLNADYAEAYHNRGRARAAKDDVDGAIADYTEALKRKEKYPEALADRARAKERQGDKPGAMGDYAQALRVVPKDWPQREKVQDRMKALWSGKEERK